jgi:hypothetical protein
MQLPMIKFLNAGLSAPIIRQSRAGGEDDMKMSQETINRLFVAVAVLLVVYGLVLQQNRATAPGLMVPVSTTGIAVLADRLDIETAEGSKRFDRWEGRWLEADKEVEAAKPVELLEAVENLRIVRVVSIENNNPRAYGLAPEGADVLNVYREGAILYSFILVEGERDDRFFLQIGAERRVYEAEGDLRLLVRKALK